MKTIEDTIYSDSKKIINSNILKKIINYVKENKILIILAYIVGTIGIFIRNYIVGLPFSPTNIIQSFIILIYMFLLLLPYIKLECLYIKLFNNLKNNMNKIYIVTIIASLLITYIILSLLLMSYTKSVIEVIIYYIFFPFISIFINGDKDVWKIMILICFYFLVLSIPMQIGGLKAQKVSFIEYDTNSSICYMYNYYGINDGLYQFKKGKKVIMIPIDKGYITYIYKQ